jgi:hypothetical protein
MPLHLSLYDYPFKSVGLNKPYLPKKLIVYFYIIITFAAIRE